MVKCLTELKILLWLSTEDLAMVTTVGIENLQISRNLPITTTIDSEISPVIQL